MPVTLKDNLNYVKDMIKIHNPRLRSWVLYLGAILILGLLVVVDPDNHYIHDLNFPWLDKFSGAIRTLTTILRGGLAISLVYFYRKALHDYKVADMERLGMKAIETPEGAGLYAISIAIQVLAYAAVTIGAFFI